MLKILLLVISATYTLLGFAAMSTLGPESMIQYELEKNEPPPYPPAHYYPSAERQDARLRNEICAEYANVLDDLYFLPAAQAKILRDTYRSAMSHNATAQAQLGDYYIDGKVLPHDWKQGICWYRAAAQHGSAYAQYWLAIFYQNGIVLPQDAHAAASWFARADHHAKSAAAEREVAKRYANHGTAVYDMSQAMLWYERAARQRDVQAELALGDFYATSHTPGDIHRALNWYGKAAAQHSVVAQYNIGYIYYRGVGIPQDLEEAHEWLLGAASSGYAPAQYSLAEMYDKGEGVKRDAYKAYAWLTVSGAADNNPEAERMQQRLLTEFTPKELAIASQMSQHYKSHYRSR